MRVRGSLSVLILVLVEHTLGGFSVTSYDAMEEVLILVLVEHTLGAKDGVMNLFVAKGLNPCFSGTYSRSAGWAHLHGHPSRLNPCFSGTYSRSFTINKKYLNGF